MKKVVNILGPAAFWLSFLIMAAGAVLFSLRGNGYTPLLIYGAVTFIMQLGFVIWITWITRKAA